MIFYKFSRVEISLQNIVIFFVQITFSIPLPSPYNVKSSEVSSGFLPIKSGLRWLGSPLSGSQPLQNFKHHLMSRLLRPESNLQLLICSPPFYTLDRTSLMLTSLQFNTVVLYASGGVSTSCVSLFCCTVTRLYSIIPVYSHIYFAFLHFRLLSELLL